MRNEENNQSNELGEQEQARLLMIQLNLPNFQLPVFQAPVVNIPPLTTLNIAAQIPAIDWAAKLASTENNTHQIVNDFINNSSASTRTVLNSDIANLVNNAPRENFKMPKPIDNPGEPGKNNGFVLK